MVREPVSVIAEVHAVILRYLLGSWRAALCFAPVVLGFFQSRTLVIKSLFIVGAAILQILIGGAHLAGFIASRDPSRVDTLMKEVVESLAEKQLPMPMGGGSRTYSELHDGFSVMFSILLITVGCLNCVAAPSCRDRGGLHFGLVMVNLLGMLAILWACYTYYIVFPGIVCVAAAAVMFFSLFITGRGNHAPN